MEPPTANPSPLERRFWAKVEEQPNGCLHWTGYRKPNGYGHISVGGKTILVHRLAYELQVGPIPEGLDLDHECHNEDADCAGGPTCDHRICVNGEHLKPKTTHDNVHAGRTRAAANAAKTHCAHGHPLSGDNLYVEPNGNRNCRVCKRRTWRESHRRRKEAAAA